MWIVLLGEKKKTNTEEKKPTTKKKKYMSTKWLWNFHPKHQDGPLGWDSVVSISAALPSLIVRVGNSQHSQGPRALPPIVLGSALRASGGIAETNRREAAGFTFPRAISAKSQINIEILHPPPSTYSTTNARFVPWPGTASPEWKPHFWGQNLMWAGERKSLTAPAFVWVQGRVHSLHTRAGNTSVPGWNARRWTRPSGPPLCPSFQKKSLSRLQPSMCCQFTHDTCQCCFSANPLQKQKGEDKKRKKVQQKNDATLKKWHFRQSPLHQ